MKHCTDDELLAHVEGRSSRPELAAHLSECNRCGAEETSLRRFIEALRETPRWTAPDSEARTDDGGFLARLLSFRTRLSDERAAAAVALGSDGPDELRLRPASIGLVEKINERILQQLERAPHEALTLADVAIELSNRLPLDEDRVLRANACGTSWKNRANVLMHLGSYDDALTALDIAAANFSEQTAAAFDLATVSYVRGCVHYRKGEAADALPLLERAAATFADHGEQLRYLHAQLVIATLLFELEGPRAAKERLLELLPAVQATHDRPTLARLYNNLGQCFVSLGDGNLAETYCRQALLLYRQLGMRSEQHRTSWILARQLVRAGNYAEAVSRLQEVEASFEQMAMPVDASLVTLDLVEAMTLAGEDDAVSERLRRAIDRFIAAPLPQQTRIALARLRETSEPLVAVPELRQLFESIPREAQAVPC